tara:strand:- start:2471 stop:2938 length:468 start_codon:yes stop_codon:yes gene_type:complete
MLTDFSEQDWMIVEKIQSYCIYQDRCEKEVKKKLYTFNVEKDLQLKIINYLIDNDYLNEERFTKLFIQGKLRIKKWGKMKLKFELKSRGVENSMIDKYINEISDDEYTAYFNEFSSNKIKFLKGTKDQKKRSFINYFTYRGWENYLIYQKLKDIS